MSLDLDALWQAAALAASRAELGPPPTRRPEVAALSPPRTAGDLAQLIDQTLLRPDATDDEVDAFLAESRPFPFKAVCLHGRHVARAVRALDGTAITVAAVIGFPHGAVPTAAKVAEAEMAHACGAAELDMVIPIGSLRSGQLGEVSQDIGAVRRAVPSVVLKVILETCLLSPQEMATGALVAALAGADLVKTSTGFAQGGATPESVRILRAMVPGRVGVKASGGVRSLAELFAMVAAGATRIGTSRGLALLHEFSASHGGHGLARA